MWYMQPSAQGAVFLYSVLFGAALCLCYDLLRRLKRAFKLPYAVIFALDILYSVFAAFSTFCFMLVTSGGVVRWFIIAGEAIGFVLFRVVFAPVFSAASKILNII